MWKHIRFLGGVSFLGVYSPTVIMPCFIYFCSLTIQDSSPFISESILSWYVTRNYSSRLLSYTFLGQPSLAFLLPSHTFLLLDAVTPFYEHVLLHRPILQYFPCLDFPHLLTRWKMKLFSLKGSQDSDLGHLLSRMLDHSLVLNLVLQRVLWRKIQWHTFCAPWSLLFPHDKIRDT